MRAGRRQFALSTAGLALIVAAAWLSSDTIERILIGRADGSLSWGPGLFRVMLAIHGFVLLACGIATRRMVGSADHRQEEPLTSEVDGLGKRHWSALAALTLVALALRLWRLDSGLWLDEVFTLLDFGRVPLTEVVTMFPSQNQHMLYSVLMHLPLALWGESAWALRLPAVLFGVGGVWAVFLLGRKLVGVHQALLASALMTVSYHHVWFSQNARGYTGLLLFTTLATWLWLEARDRQGWRWWIAYGVALWLGLWVHTTMVFVVAAHVLVELPSAARTLYRARRSGKSLRATLVPRKPVAAWLLSGTLSLQVYALSLPEFFRTALHETSMDAEWANPLWAATESLRSLEIGWSSVAVLLFGSLLAASGWWSLFRKSKAGAIAMVLPGLLGGTLVVAIRHNLWPRFFFFLMAFALLVAVHGAFAASRFVMGRRRTPGNERSSSAVGAVLVALMIAASAATVPRCYALPKQDFVGARDFVERRVRPGETIVAVGLAARVYGGYFAPHWTAVQEYEPLRQARQTHKNTWLVYTLPIEIRAFQPRVWKTIERDFEVVKMFPGTLGEGEVFVCRERDPASRQ